MANRDFIKLLTKFWNHYFLNRLFWNWEFKTDPNFLHSSKSNFDIKLLIPYGMNMFQNFLHGVVLKKFAAILQ